MKRLSFAVALCALAACSAASVADNVTVVEVSLTPPEASVEAGRTIALIARPTDGNGDLITNRPVVWSSNNRDVATVSTVGVVSARNAGTARIAASVDGQSAVANITVTEREVASVQVTPLVVSVRVNRSVALQARALDAQGGELSTRSVSWSSSDPAVATINAQGLVTGLTPGAATITATSGGRSGQAAVTVTPEPVASVTVSPASDTLAVGTERELSAVVRDADGVLLTDRSVAWSVSDPNVASISSVGVVTALAPGTVTAVALSEGRVGQANIVVLQRLADAIILTPSSSTVEVGATVQLLAQVTDPNGNLLTGRTITFSSSDAAVASVSSQGLVSARAPGVARITALSDGKTAVTTITVIAVPVAEVSVSPGSTSVIVGDTRALAVEARSASGIVLVGRPTTWISGAPSIATVNASGVVSAVAPGTAIIVATVGGVSGSATVQVEPRSVAQITITPASPEIAVGAQQQLQATVRDAQGSVLAGRNITWTTSNESVVFVGSTGLIVGIGAGSATITATSEGVSASTTVVVR